MNRALPLLCAFIGVALAVAPAQANDADGPDDCVRDTLVDYGDAPEGFEAYPGVLGKFPTCLAPGATAVTTADCPQISTLAGPAGFVRHVQGRGGYWMACVASGSPPLGIDFDAAPKTSSGAAASACNAQTTVDGYETFFGVTFGQDETYGSNDAGLASPKTFTRCATATVGVNTYNCSTEGRYVYLNVLVDWNQDGDWNDAFRCGSGCSYEWATKNVQRWLPPGGSCDAIYAPVFTAGPYLGRGWMRITLTDAPVPDDFPWNGSAGVAGQSFQGGETEDYPIEIVMSNDDPCFGEVNDFGDAPEGIPAYPSGVLGRFPSCTSLTPAGTREAACTPLGTPPGLTGHVVHTKLPNPTNNWNYWMGCGTTTGAQGIDGETDAKVNASASPGDPSACGSGVSDCVESAFAPSMYFGQDECRNDSVDAARGVFYGPFVACSTARLFIRTNTCAGPYTDCFFILNVLVDWNMDGDWNDSFVCPSTGACVQEWAIKNAFNLTGCGCSFLPTGLYTGPYLGKAWMRVTLTLDNVPDDFPWNGSRSMPQGLFSGGETEDYVVDIVPTLTGVPPDAGLPRLALGAPRPNPAHGPLTVPFTLDHASTVTLAAYDATGRRVRVLASGEMPAGEHERSWDFRDARGAKLPVGLYWIRLDAGGTSVTRRVSHIE